MMGERQTFLATSRLPQFLSTLRFRAENRRQQILSFPFAEQRVIDLALVKPLPSRPHLVSMTGLPDELCIILFFHPTSSNHQPSRISGPLLDTLIGLLMWHQLPSAHSRMRKTGNGKGEKLGGSDEGRSRQASGRAGGRADEADEIAIALFQVAKMKSGRGTAHTVAGRNI
jgi:hypothetical protein